MNNPGAEMSFRAADQAARGRLGFFLSVLRARPSFALGYAIVFVVCLCAIFAPLIAPYDPVKADPMNFLKPPSWTHWMGTDATGMDIASASHHLRAAHASLAIALAGTVISAILGSLLGAAAGYQTQKGVWSSSPASSCAPRTCCRPSPSSSSPSPSSRCWGRASTAW